MCWLLRRRWTPSFCWFLLLFTPTPQRSTLFPYTTLFRSMRELIDVEKVFHLACPNRETLFGRLKKRDLGDRKSTRLNSSHVSSSYAVFCLIKKRGRSRLNRR